jgi:hypothetical protein
LVSSSQIRQQIASFVDRQIDLQTFRLWLVKNTWDVSKSGSVAAESLAFAIEEALSDYSDQIIDAGQLRDQMFALLDSETKIIEIGHPDSVIVCSMASSPSRLIPLTA